MAAAPSNFSQYRLCYRRFGVNQNSDLYGPWHQCTQQFQPLRCDLSTQVIDPCDVATGPGEARDETKPDRVFADGKDDWDRRGCRLGRECGRVSRRGDHRDLSTNQIACQRRQSIQLSLGPTIFDRDVLPLDVSGLVQASAKRAQTDCILTVRSRAEEPDHRHRRLLRARRERPRRRAPPSSVMNSRRLVCRESSIVKGDGGRFMTAPPSRLEARSRLGS